MSMNQTELVRREGCRPNREFHVSGELFVKDLKRVTGELLMYNVTSPQLGKRPSRRLIISLSSLWAYLGG